MDVVLPKEHREELITNTDGKFQSKLMKQSEMHEQGKVIIVHHADKLSSVSVRSHPRSLPFDNFDGAWCRAKQAMADKYHEVQR